MFALIISIISITLVATLAVATLYFGCSAFKNKDSIIIADNCKTINNKNKKGWKYGFKKY
jgi:hypothetical protein